MKNILKHIRSDLKKLATKEKKRSGKKFSKEEFKTYGCKVPDMRLVAKKFWPEVKKMDLPAGLRRAQLSRGKEIWKLCDLLVSSQILDEMTVGIDFAWRLKSKYKSEDYQRFYKWLSKYVNTWMACDDLCGKPFGFLFFKYPELAPKVLVWAKSKNRWVRRAAGVSLLYSLRRGKQLDLAFQVAEILLEDSDDLVQKGYGWMLKEACKHFEDQVFDFVMQNKTKMPRTALRYAIEKMSVERKKEAMG